MQQRNFLWTLVVPDIEEPKQLFKLLPNTVNMTLLLVRPILIFKKADLLLEVYSDLMEKLSLWMNKTATTALSDQVADTKNITTFSWICCDDAFFMLDEVNNKIISKNLLVGIYEIQIEGPKVRNDYFLAHWSSLNSLTLLKPMKFNEIKVRKIYRICTMLQSPFVMRDPKQSSGYSGYSIDLLDQMAEILQFDYTITENLSFGQLLANGSWTGIVHELLEKNVDIAVGTMSVMAERENVIDFTVAYYDQVGLSILMNIPRQPSDWFRFLTVMERDVWLCILAAYFATSIILWIVDRVSPFSFQNNPNRSDDDKQLNGTRIFTLKECLWYCLMCLTPQGGGAVPRSISAKIVVAAWWLFGFIIVASYTANLAAFLTVNSLETPIESLEDLANQFQIKYAPIEGSLAMTYLERMADIEQGFYDKWKEMTMNDSLSNLERKKFAVWEYPLGDRFIHLWNMTKRTGPPKSIDEAIARIRNSTFNSGFALIGDATDLRYLTLKHCDLKMVGLEFSQKPYAFGVQQGSPLKQELDSVIHNLLSNRWLSQLKQKWWPIEENRIRCTKQRNNFDGIALDNIGGFFLTMFMGIILAIFTLLGEYYWFKRKNRLHLKKLETTTLLRTYHNNLLSNSQENADMAAELKCGDSVNESCQSSSMDDDLRRINSIKQANICEISNLILNRQLRRISSDEMSLGISGSTCGGVMAVTAVGEQSSDILLGGRRTRLGSNQSAGSNLETETKNIILNKKQAQIIEISNLVQCRQRRRLSISE